MIYWELFLGFLKVGCFSFGGAYGAIPLIRDVVLSNGWMSEATLADMISVSESTPGPIMINMATYAGNTQGGVLGAIVATLAVILPSFIIIVAVTAALKTLLKNQYVQATLRGMKPAIIGIILATGLFMIITNCLPAAGAAFDARTVVITVVLAAVMFGSKPVFKKKVSPIVLILISAVLGIGMYGF